MRLPRQVRWVPAALALICPSLARGDPPPHPVDAPVVMAWDVRLAGFVGGYGGSSGGGVAGGGMLLGRLGPLEGGALLQLGAGSVGMFSAALLGGLGLQLGGTRSGGFRLELLGELGIDQESGIDAGLLSGPGASGSTALYGLRLGLSGRHPCPGRVQRGIGMWVAAEDATLRGVAYQDCGLFGCSMRTADIGGARLLVGIGGVLDFGP